MDYNNVSRKRNYIPLQNSDLLEFEKEYGLDVEFEELDEYEKKINKEMDEYDNMLNDVADKYEEILHQVTWFLRLLALLIIIYFIF